MSRRMIMRTLSHLVHHRFVGFVAAAILAAAIWPFASVAAAQSAPPPQAPAPAPAPGSDAGRAPLPTDYVIGPNDVLTIFYWREKDLSAEVAVRPDGKITLPLLNDVQASGLTPDALRARIAEAAARFVESPVVSVSVKTINSRKVYITGMVAKPGEYALMGPTTVLQLIAVAGGLLDFADDENISILRPSEKDTRGQAMSYRVNYNDLKRRLNLAQNIELKPGDTIVVP
jgi:polysaccharide biosynthesis/export protein